MIRRIIHIGDIQINCDNNHAERAFEYRSVLARCSADIEAKQPDFVVIAGDIFERHQTTDDERKIYVDFIHNILSKVPNCNIIVIDGNHDIRKRNLKYFDGVDTSMYSNVLESLRAAINNSRYKYSRDSAVYDYGDIKFACWSECAKYDDSLTHSPYEKHMHLLDGNAFVVDVYHGNIAGAVDLGTHFYVDKSDDELHGHIAMLGHIHKYQVLGNAVYSSSLVPRQFNEGVRYGINKCIYDYRNAHGYVEWTIDTEAKTVKHAFVPIASPVQFITFTIDSDTTKDDLLSVFALHCNEHARIKLVLDNAKPETLAFAYNYCRRTSTWSIKSVETANASNAPDASNDYEVSGDRLELTPETLTELSAALIAPVINKQHYDDKDYAKAVSDKTLELLKQEAGYHLHPENRNRIKLLSATIDNFKTIGHAELVLLDHGLQALRGQNGQGKTTCIEAIAFALTGQHNATFKRNAKNKQLLRLFNDKLPAEHVARVAVDVSIDDTVYTVLVVLTKHMQDGWTPTDWKRFVSKVDKQLQIISNDKVIATDNDADNWLMQRFGTYEEFAILHMIDQQTLESLKYMSNDQFANFILQRLGYSVLSKLQYYYNGCKSVELEKCPKPTNLSYVQVCQAIDDLLVYLKQETEELSSIENSIAECEATVNALMQQIAVTTAKKQSMPQELIDNWRMQLMPFSGCDLNKYGEQLEQSLASARMELQQLSEQEDRLRIKHDERAKKLDVIIAVAKEQLSAAIQSKTTDKNNLQQSLAAVTEQNDAISRQRTELEAKLTSANAELSAKQLELDALRNACAQLHTERQQVQFTIANAKPDTCPTCGQAISRDKFVEWLSKHEQQIRDYDNAIKLKQQLIADKESEAELAKNTVNSIKVSLANVPAYVDMSEITNAMSVIDAEITTLHSKLAELASQDYQQRLLEVNEPAFMQELHELEQSVQQLRAAKPQTKLDNLLSSQQMYAEAVQAKAGLEQYNAIIANNRLIDEELSKLNTALNQSNADIALKRTAKSNCLLAIDRTKQQINQNEQLKSSIVQYNIVTEALQHYKWLIDTALPQYLYKSTCSIVNKFIAAQNLPSTIQPWLSETEYGQLVLRDRNENGDVITRTILEASGMEITIVGLVVCFALHAANLTVNFPMVMLDELTGKLSTGNATDDTDYLALFLHVLKNASEHCQILAIDHRLKDEDFDKVTVCIKDKISNISYIE